MAYVAADYNAKVQAYFVTTLGRPATSPELAQFSQGLVDNAGSVWTSGLVTYLTTQTGFPSGTNYGQIVTDMYTNLTGAAPALTAYNFYVGQLSVGSIKLKGLANAILNDNGYMPKADGTYGSPSGWVTSAATVGSNAADLATLQLKVGAAATFTAALDTAAENTDIATTSGYTAAKNWLTAVVDTASAAAATTASANTAIAAVSGAGSVGQTFTLTTGVDNGTSFKGGTGNDSYTGTDTTLTGLDSLDGSTGTDTLTINDVAGGLNIASGAVTIANIETATFQSTGALTVDASLWSGLTALNTTKSAAATLTAAATTNVTVTGATGAVGVTGGLAQTVTTSGGAITLTGAAGAITATHSAQAANNIGIDNGTSVTATASAVTTGTLVVGNTTAPSGAVSLSSTGNYTDGANVTLGAITVNGGSTVSVTQSAGLTAAEITAATTDASNFTVTQSALTVNGKSTTTAVTLTQDAAQTEVDSATAGKIGIVNGAVTIADLNSASATAANTIATVTLNNFAAATINSAALTTINLTGTGTSLGVTQGALTTPTVTTQALNLNGVTTTGAVTLDADITTLNVASSTTASTLNSLSATGATTVNVSGDAKLTLTGQTLSAATAINVTNTGGVSLGTALGNSTAFTSVGGADTIAIGATTKTISTGAGDDSVTVNAAALGTGGTIDAGEGTDTLTLTAANAATATASSTFAGVISNFDILSIGDSAGGETINMANADGITYLKSAGVSAGGLTVNNLAANSTLEFTALIGAASAASLASAGGASDVVNLKFSATNGFTSTQALTIANVETLNITTDDTDTTAPTTVFTAPITATSAKSVTVSGDVGINLTGLTSTALTTLNASGVTATGAAGAVTLTTGALAGASTITGGAGNDVFDAAAALAAVTLSGNAGNDTLTGGTLADTVSGGAGDDFIYGNEGADTLTGDAGTDVFTVLTAAHSNGVNQDTVTDFTAGTDKAGAAAAVTYAGEANGYGAVLTSLTSVAYQAVLDTSTSTLYIDVDGNAALTVADVTVKMTGVTDLSQTDFAAVGTAGGDAIVGTAVVDTIYGLAGADTITGGLGADIITTGTGADKVVVTGGLTLDTVTDFTTGAGGDKVQIDISSTETAGAVEAAITISLDDLVDGTTAIGASAATIQEVADQAGGAAAAAAGAATVYVLLTETYANLGALETGLETGDHELTVHANAAQHDGFIVVWSDGTDSHVSMVRIAVDSGADFAAADLVATDLVKIVGTGTITAGEFHADNFAFIA